MEFELGRTYSGYKFLDVVRRSRNLVQYRVQNTLAQRLENLQTLPTAATDDQEASERFLREVRIRARLQHPHVVSFYTALPVEGRMVMTTEL
jgi:serine/threonine protein kinase